METLKFPERYTQLTEIGAGGMGKIYKALDQNLGKYVAIKVLHSDLSVISPKSLQRFQKEAKLLGSLQHENLVPILDFNITDDGIPYQVMEYVGGKNLDELIADGLTVEQSFHIIWQVALAMHRAHKKGVIHRDLKPTNIIVGMRDKENLSARVIDFGIAFQIAAEDGLEALTATNAIIGSPLYMSPEQAKTDRIDERSDIYSLGTSLYKCLTGEVPVQGNNPMETIALKNKEPAPSLSSAANAGFDEEIENFVGRCLAIDPNERPQTMIEVLQNIYELNVLNEEDEAYKEALMEIAPFVSTKEESKPTDSNETSNLSLMALAAGIAIISFTLFSLSNYLFPTEPEVKGISHEELELEELQSQRNNRKDYYSFRSEHKIYKSELELVAKFNNRIRLELEGAKIPSPEVLKVLIDTNYRQFSAGHGNFNDDHLKVILQMKKLDTLKINDSKITIEGIKLISKSDKLHTLNIGFIVTNEALKYIAEMKNLSTLAIADSPKITDEGLKYLHQCRRLHKINLNGCPNITEEGVTELEKAIPNRLVLFDKESSPTQRELMRAK